MVTPLKLLNNRYRIIETLGRGGFGETFLARDTHMPSARKCVIKHLKPVLENPEIPPWLRDRFHREAAILEELGENHPQIPQLYAYFSEGEDFYLVQEWIPGLTLAQAHAQKGNFSSTAVEELLLGILPVLQFIHQRRIIHRDIKPDNIILREADGKPILIDFGIIKETMGTLVNPDGRSAYSVALGTPGYMASEQAAGRPVFSSDLYSLGLTAIFLLTGKTPQYLTSDSRTGEILWRQGAPQVSPTLAKVIDQAVRYHPRERFSSATAMAQALQGSFSNVSMAAGDRQDNTIANTGNKIKPNHQPTAPTLVVGTPYNANDTQATKVYSQEFTGYTETQEGSPLIKWVVMPLVVLLVIAGGMAAGFWVTNQRRNNPPPTVEESPEETPTPLPSLQPRPDLFETPTPTPLPVTPSPEVTASPTPEPEPTPTEGTVTPMEPEPTLNDPAPPPEPEPKPYVPSPSPSIAPEPSPTISIPVTPAPVTPPKPSPSPKPISPPKASPTPAPVNPVPVIPPPENPSNGNNTALPAPPAAEKPIDPGQN